MTTSGGIKPAKYLAGLSVGRFILWCYFIYWLVIAVRYFDPNIWLWLTSLGLSLIIGVALFINAAASGRTRVRLEAWPTFRLFLTPFCVSSFAALVKGHGFFVIFSPRWTDSAIAAALCAALAIAWRVFRQREPRTMSSDPSPAQEPNPDGSILAKHDVI